MQQIMAVKHVRASGSSLPRLQPFVRHRVLKIHIQFAVKVTGFTGQCGDGAGMQQLKQV